MGFPSNLHALYVDQLASTCAECSVMELVMDADKDVLLWQQQADLLQVWPQIEGKVLPLHQSCSLTCCCGGNKQTYCKYEHNSVTVLPLSHQSCSPNPNFSST